MKRILSFVMCFVMLVSLASILSACDGETETTTTSSATTSESTTNTTEVTTTESTTTTDTTTTDTTTEITTTTKTQGDTTTKNQTPVSNSPFDNKKCVLMHVRSWDDDTVRGKTMQCVRTAAGVLSSSVDSDVYVEFGEGTTIYYDDGRAPLHRRPTNGYFPRDTWLLVAVDSAPYGLFGIKSTAVKVLTTWEDRLTLTMRYIENNPNLKTTYTKIDIADGYCKEILAYESDGDNVYALLSPGRLIEINSKTGQITKDAPLSPEPYEMRIYGNEIWVSFGKERVIAVFDKSTLDIVRTITVPKPVFSFDVYNDYLYYADSADWGYAYRYNMSTGQNDLFNGDWRFHQAEVLVNTQANCVYVAETDSSDSMIIAFDLEGLSYLHSTSQAHSGVPNIEIYNGMMYWSYYRLDTTKLSTKKKYMEVDFKGVFSVTSKYIAASDGIYDRSSLTLVNSMQNATGTFTIITKSGNIVMWRAGAIHIATKK